MFWPVHSMDERKSHCCERQSNKLDKANCKTIKHLSRFLELYGNSFQLCWLTITFKRPKALDI